MQLSSSFGASLVIRAFSMAFVPGMIERLQVMDLGEKRDEVPDPTDESSIRSTKSESMARRQVPIRHCRYSRCG